ncbi:MAG: hypothetical protein AAB673_00710 [Patescibacteria group bacterium]
MSLEARFNKINQEATMEARIYRVHNLRIAGVGGSPRPEAVAVVGDYVIFNLDSPEVYKGPLRKFLRENGYVAQTRLVGKTILPDWVVGDRINALCRHGNRGDALKKLVRQHIKYLVPKRL